MFNGQTANPLALMMSPILLTYQKNFLFLCKAFKEIISKNMLIEHKPYQAHAFQALEKTELLAFVNGRRGGKNYEDDTFRLKDKLI